MQTNIVVYRDNREISAISKRYFRWNDISAIYRGAIVLTTARYCRNIVEPHPHELSFSLSNISFELSDISFELSDISFELSDKSFFLNDISFKFSDISFELSDISLPPNDISFKLSDISLQLSDILFASVRYRHG